MLEIFGILIIVGTIIIAGRQPENATGKIICIFLVGFMLLSAIAELKY